MKRTGFSLWELIGVLALVLVAGVVFWPVYSRGHPPSGKSTCQTNLKHIALGVRQYLNDFDERYPLVAVTNHSSKNYAPPYGWADALQPYLRNTFVYCCPSDAHENQDVSGQSGFTDYWFNRNMDGVAAKDLISGAQTILIGDGDGGSSLTDARYAIAALPRAWRKNPQSPARYHLGGGNYLFADGHIKWSKPQRIATASPPSCVYTFAIK